MKAFTSRFRLGTPSAHSQVNNEQDNDFSASRASNIIEFRVHDDLSPQKHPVGSFDHDLASGKYKKQWNCWRDFETWLAAEQESHALEFRLVNTYTGSSLYTRQLRYVCSRAGTGGQKEYNKLHPDWNRKRGPKRTDRKCTLIVKQYPDTSMVLGNYSDIHNHDLGNANLPFTQIPKATREYIAGLLRLKVAPEHILKMLHRGVYDHDELFTQDLDENYVASRMEFIELRDIRRIEKEIKAEAIRLHPDDGQSTTLWVQRLRDKGHLLAFKSKTDPVPPRSNLAHNLFLLVIQTNWQRQIFAKYGDKLVCIDATHNVTMYENLNLTTLVETITYFLKANQLQSPATIPRRIISDFDWAQIHSCINVYNTIILLRWWHVLHTWQQHFSIPTYPELWALLKNWIRITNQVEFDATLPSPPSLAQPSAGNIPEGFSGPKPHALIVIAEKLERLASRLRRPRKKDETTPALAILEDALDEMLLATETSSVLPAAQHLAPAINARSVMMPGIKTKCTRAGDNAYGAGASSGSKAKKETKKSKTMSIHPAPSIPSTNLPAPIPAPAAPPIVAPTPPQPFPSPAYPFTYYHPVSYIYPMAPQASPSNMYYLPPMYYTNNPAPSRT
ncbi:hypothetical protein MVEN_00072600 [Mycena venus]|uniref:FAR1 domain-containing protein n=1 Tax=Mycena venus TaxID=2733690 RepID=A0A8H6Z775_9AGAR|nr:hypothetical protein MVEN_00072600 [Mycena venus]